MFFSLQRLASIKRMHVEVGRKQTEDYQKRLDKLKDGEVRRIFFPITYEPNTCDPLVELHAEITRSTSSRSTHAQLNFSTVDERLNLNAEEPLCRFRRDPFLSSKIDFDPSSVSMPQHQPISSKVITHQQRSFLSQILAEYSSLFPSRTGMEC